MLYEYGGWTIDAIPDFSLGKFFARATLTRASPDPGADAEMHQGRDLAWFDSKDEAVEFARQWAITWIDDQSARLRPTEPASTLNFRGRPATATRD